MTGLKYKNIELLRFIFIWAIVGFHIVYLDQFKEFGFDWLKKYMIFGALSVKYFFIIAFYFLVSQTSGTEKIIPFIVKKWWRLAPLITIATFIGYVFHLLGYWGWNWSVNIENIFLIKDWADHPRWGQFIHPAWWCAEYLLVAVFYLALIKTFSKQICNFMIGIIAILAWRIYICRSNLPDYGIIVLHKDMCVALFCLGIAYFIHEINDKNIKNSTHSTLLSTIIEICLLYIILVKLFFPFMSIFNELLSMSAFSYLFISFINQKGYISRLLNKNWCAYLGKFSYAIFIMHIVVLDVSRKVIFPQCKEWVINHNTLSLVGIMGTIIFLSFWAHYYIEIPAMKWAKRRLSYV